MQRRRRCCEVRGSATARNPETFAQWTDLEYLSFTKTKAARLLL
jgi:hypothetical protein